MTKYMMEKSLHYISEGARHVDIINELALYADSTETTNPIVLTKAQVRILLCHLYPSGIDLNSQRD